MVPGASLGDLDEKFFCVCCPLPPGNNPIAVNNNNNNNNNNSYYYYYYYHHHPPVRSARCFVTIPPELSAFHF